MGGNSHRFLGELPPTLSRNPGDTGGSFRYSVMEKRPPRRGGRPQMMTPRYRLILMLTLLAAFLVASLVPADGSWSCPDGTTCVYTAGRGFHCVGDDCALACCAGKRHATCCGSCEHGAQSGMAAASASRAAIGAAAHCHFHEALQAGSAWVAASPAPVLHGDMIAVLQAVPAAPRIEQRSVRLMPIRGSPPASRRSPCVSPRAPPGSDCA